MQPTSHAFKENARKALADEPLRQALERLGTAFATAQQTAAADLPEFDRLCDQARAIKDHVLANLDFYLERFEARVLAQGGVVHWCATPREARETILALCRQVDAKSATKGKSMIAEEIALNPFLEANGIAPIETDLGEYIIQLADEPPSHLIAPAVHKTKEAVADLFVKHHAQYGMHKRHEEAAALLEEARQVLRAKYFEADVGITGANFLIAENGAIVTVTNEGNAELTQILPDTHIVITSLEKVVPTLEDATTILRVLARSATGQEFSSYTTFSAGGRRDGDLDGPTDFHVVLLDNGRTKMLGTEFQDMLRCIRCGACLNHCPIYSAVGGHAYGWVYSGPMGAVLAPQLIGLEAAGDLPNASTFCGRCEAVCPMRIPLPKMMRHWREQEFERHLQPPPQRLGLAIWSWFVRRPRAYRALRTLAVRTLRLMGGRKARIGWLPGASGWTAGRDLPAPEGRGLHALMAQRKR